LKKLLAVMFKKYRQILIANLVSSRERHHDNIDNISLRLKEYNNGEIHDP